MISRFFQLCMFLTACVAVGAEETRFFVSTAGTLLEAELVAVAGENVTLRKKDDGRELTVAKATLCKEDHAYIETWMTRNPDASKGAPAPATPAPVSTPGTKFSLTSTIRGAKSNRGDSYYRTVVQSYTVTLQNREVKRDLTGAKGVIVTISKEAAGGDRLYAMQRVEFDVNLRAQSKMEHSTPEVSLSYYQDSGNRDGAKEHGCLFAVLDATGAVLYVDATPTGTEKYAKEILGLTVPCVVDREFKANPNLSLPSTIVLTP